MHKGLGLYHSLWPSPIWTLLQNLHLCLPLRPYTRVYLGDNLLAVFYESKKLTVLQNVTGLHRYQSKALCCALPLCVLNKNRLYRDNTQYQSWYTKPWRISLRKSIHHQSFTEYFSHTLLDKAQRAPELPLLILCCPLQLLNLSFISKPVGLREYF